MAVEKDDLYWYYYAPFTNNMYPKVNEYNKPPCTGTGFTASSEHLMLEYTCFMKYDETFNQVGVEIFVGAIYQADTEGKESMIGRWDDID